MIAYLIDFTPNSEMTATSIVSLAEVSAALAKAARTGLVTRGVARHAGRSFAREWPDLVRVPITEALVERADTLAWEHGLRGYDAVQLASALSWQESVGRPTGQIRRRVVKTKMKPEEA